MGRSPRAGDETLIELLVDFAADLKQTGGSVAAADSDALRAHLGRLAGRSLATASVARRLSAIRQLYR